MLNIIYNTTRKYFCNNITPILDNLNYVGKPILTPNRQNYVKETNFNIL